MRTALLSFALALVAPIAHAANCPSQSTQWDWAQFNVTIHLTGVSGASPQANLLWQLGPDAPAPTGYSYNRNTAPASVNAEADTSSAWKLLYDSLDYRRTAHAQLTCAQLYSAMGIAARSGLHLTSIYQTEADAFWDAYFAGKNRAAELNAHPVLSTIWMYASDGDYPAQDIADMLDVFGL